ncbi:lytic transglycosylase domain-containing protein [Mesorhizobium sp. WSM3626]|uniref:lytic transglycosylase domain-containing protein n=1 Tax=Mesorhizobium sp. WSM3626 TaxID=1040987 RepID=UPI001FD8B65D|nr:lytic transglycosylase domain-containing protein [Mesorhizobium sp. WSM3626]
MIGRRSLALERREHDGRLLARRDDGARVATRQCVAMLSTCALLMLGSAPGAAQAPSQPVPKSCAGTTIAENENWSAYVCEAAKRFDLPEHLIRAVMHVESGGDVRAISPKSAAGLMQIMPATWAELRIKHGLGTDPFNPRDNILAGAAYLREMLDRFGTKGLLAAYNAGPQRYQEHLSNGRPLPRETIDYVAKLRALIKGSVEIRPRSQRLGDRSSADRSQLFDRDFARKNDVGWRGKRDSGSIDQTVFTEILSANMPPRIDAAVDDLTALEPTPDVDSDVARPTPDLAGNSLFIPRSRSTSR